jgi:hypothetical protein
MTKEELINKTISIYDEYIPEQSTDTDIKEFLTPFIEDHINDFLFIAPTSIIPIFIKTDINQTINSINYKGGYFVLPNDFLKLVSFKHKDWERKLYYEDLIEANHPRRKLQNNKFTSGKTSRPVICIEYIEGLKSICFWSYKKNINSLEDFTYIKTATIDEFINLNDWILIAYIYYVLSFVFTTTQQPQLSDIMLKEFAMLLQNHNIEPTQPITFNNQKATK